MSTTNNDTPYLDFIEYRCALVCQSFNDASKDVRQYDIVPATEDQKNLVFGVVRFTDPLFTKGINNIRFELFHDRRTDNFILVFYSTKTLYDWVDNIQQFFGVEAELYQQVKEIASKIRPELRDKIIFTGHSLGGGLAVVAALICGSQAIVFNPPKIHRNTLSGPNQSGARIDRYRVKGDIASLPIPWSANHIEMGRETKLTTLPFASFHSLDQVLAGLRTEFSFSVFLINAVVEMLQSRVGVHAAPLRRTVFDIVRGKPVKPNTLPDLLEIDYRVERVGAGNAKVSVFVMYRKDKMYAEMIEYESDWKWEDLPEEFREDFIRSRDKSLNYSVYKQG